MRRFVEIARALKLKKQAVERERWPREQLEAWQLERLRALAAHAAERSPFWRERIGPDPRRVELRDLPTLDKATMMESYDDLVTDRRLRREDLLAHIDEIDHDALYLDEFRAMTTSGSSGLKGLFVYDRSGWAGLLSQFFRYTDWVGSTPKLPRRRIAAIGGAAPAHMTRRCAESVDVGIHRVMSLPITAPVEELVDALNEFQPDFINVFPSLAGVLAAEAEAGRLRIRPSGMSTSSELRPAGLPERLQAAFGIRPFDFYAMTEGLWACECEERCGVHLFEDTCIVENVDQDGRAVPPGEPGARILVTNLFNQVQPLIRFEVSDVLTMAAEPCECGRTLMRVQSIQGRSDDVLDLGGVRILPMQFGVLTADPAVRQFQVVQRGRGVAVRVVLQPDVDETATATRLRAAVAARLSAAGVANPGVSVEACDELERGAGGKLKLVVADEMALT